MSMTISLGAFEEFARAKVESGDFDSISEVIAEGLRLLKQRDDDRMSTMQAQIDEGMAECRAGLTIPASEVWAELRVLRDSVKTATSQ